MAGEIQLNSTTLATESTGTITLTNVDSATNRTNLGLGSMATQAANSVSITGGAIGSSVVFPAGHVIQVLQTVKTDTFSSGVNASFTAVTGLSKAITLSNASNKVLVMVQLSAVNESSGGGGVSSIFRGATNILVADTGSSNQLEGGVAFEQYNSDADMPPVTMFMQKLDTPGSIGPHTYAVYVAGDANGNTIYVNRTESDTNSFYIQRTTSSITLMEIQG